MAVRRKKPERVISREVVALRRAVWLRRLAALVVLAVLGFSWQAYLDARYADKRAPSIALAEGAQVYTDAWQWLMSPYGQLALQLSYTDFGRAGRPGEYNPAMLTMSRGGNTTSVRLNNYGSVSETGAPVILPGDMRIVQHVAGRAGDVRLITVNCTYRFCWDRHATSGVILAAGGQLPAATTTQYSYTFSVTDLLTLSLSNRSGTWVPQLVRREDRSTIRP